LNYTRETYIILLDSDSFTKLTCFTMLALTIIQ